MLSFLRALLGGEPEAGFALDVVTDDDKGTIETHRVPPNATELTVSA